MVKARLSRIADRARVLAGGRPHPLTKRLVVKGMAGLGNRLWYLLTAKAFADRWGLQLCPDWREGWYGPVGENAFFDLFELDGAGEPPADFGPVYPSFWEGRTDRTIYECIAAVQQDRGAPVSPDDMMWPLYRVLLERPAAESLFNVGWGELPDDMRVARVPYDRRAVGAALRPSARCRRVIADELPPLADCTGVHVRRTDAPGQLPLENYFRHVGEDDRPIFVCTDDHEVEAAFRERYGARVHDVPRYYHEDGAALHYGALIREEPDGAAPPPDRGRLAAEAVRDLFGLGGCGRIVHAGNSSFSRFAVQVIADERTDVRFVT
ncbi:hypothetical protein [Alienimonas sp. DA493]|uniref:hypothetical protein n=1 Tax=Alienimonas sp. DA493 TaxID=3373605 RepID=UPI00375424AE